MPDWVLLRQLDKLERSFIRLPCLHPPNSCPHCKALKTVKNLKVYAVNKPSRVPVEHASSSRSYSLAVVVPPSAGTVVGPPSEAGRHLKGKTPGG